LADEELRHIIGGLTTDILPDGRVAVFVTRPAELNTVLPDEFVSVMLVLADKVPGLMKQYCRPLNVVRGICEKIGVESDYLEGEVGRRIGVLFRY
jgi:hypothetical protein